MDLELEKAFLEWQEAENSYMELQTQIHTHKIKQQTEQTNLVIFFCFLMAWIYCNKTCDMKNISNIDFSIKLVTTFMQLIYLVHLIIVLNSSIN